MYRSPQRPSPRRVSTLLHLQLWSPRAWWAVTPDSRSVTPDRRHVMRWLLTLTAQVLCEQALGRASTGHQLRRSFLARLDFEEVMSALNQPQM